MSVTQPCGRRHADTRGHLYWITTFIVCDIRQLLRKILLLFSFVIIGLLRRYTLLLYLPQVVYQNSKKDQSFSSVSTKKFDALWFDYGIVKKSRINKN